MTNSGELLRLLIMLGFGVSSIMLIFGLISRYLIRNQVDKRDDEKPSLANTVLPIIQKDPRALAHFWGLVSFGCCYFGAAFVSRFI